jgi:hypothetical protein
MVDQTAQTHKSRTKVNATSEREKERKIYTFRPAGLKI